MTGRAALSRRAALLGGGALAAVGGSATASISSMVSGILPIGSFSVSGKSGPYIKQLAGQKLTPGGAAGGAGLGFASGQFETARLSMPQTEAKISSLIATLSAGWPYAKPPTPKINMIADGRFGPTALPDGSISVPVGFLVRAKSDDEVAFVLGHEYSHLALGHFQRLDRMTTQKSVISKLATLYAGGTTLTQIRLQQAGQQASLGIADKQKVQEATNKAASAQDQLDWVLNVLVEPAWSRTQEDQADASGFDLAHIAGYSPLDGAGQAFSELTADDSTKASTVKQMQGEVQAAITTANSSVGNNLTAANATAFMTSFGKSMLSSLKDVVVSSTSDYLSAQHRPPDQRTKGISDYSAAAYGAEKLVAPKMTWLNGVRATSEYTNAKKAVAALQAAQQARYEGDLTSARTQINAAIATPYGNLPLFLNESARIYRDKPDYANAEATFTRADSNSQQTLDGFRDHVDMCVSSGQYARGLGVIALYKSRSGAETALLPEKVRILFKQGKNDDAVAALQQCVDTQDADLKQACALSAFGPDDAEWAKLPDSTKTAIAKASGQATTKLSVDGFGQLLDKLKGSSD